MALITLNAEEFDNSIGLLQKTTNEGVIGLVGELAVVFQDSGDDNELLTQGKEAAVAYQKQYNDYIDSVGEVIEEARKLIEIDEHLKRADMGSVSGRDLSFQVDKVDTSQIIQ